MRNILTVQIESYVGAIFISLLAVFFIGLIFISIKNFDSDITIITAEQVQVKTISATERELIRNWLNDNKVEIPEEVGYRYLLQKYPSRPWLK